MRWAVWISGRGSNLQALLDCRESFQVSFVLSSRKKALGVKKATRAGVPVRFLPMKKGEGEAAVPDWEALLVLCNRFHADGILLLGFMRVLPESFITSFGRPIVNLHPSLLPLFKGKEALEQSFFSNCPMGVSIHRVTAELDSGQILLQRSLLKKPKSLELAKFCIASLEQSLLKKLFLTPSRF